MLLPYFGFILLLPIFGLFFNASQTLTVDFWARATEPIALSAYNVSLSLAFYASLFNGFFGFLFVWVLIRYKLVGKKLLDMAVDLPFALPTSVAGLTLATVYSESGWIGSFLSQWNTQIVYTRLGIFIAMIFVSFPFVIRTLQPVIQQLNFELEEASWSLGASPWQTFKKILFPTLFPTLITGMTLAFSRALGEYGSIVIMASNVPLKDLIAPVLIFESVELYDYSGATAIATMMISISFCLLIVLNTLQSKTKFLN